jgi:hypothetical protein
MTENMYAFVSHPASHTVLAPFVVKLDEGNCTSDEASLLYVCFALFFIYFLF